MGIFGKRKVKMLDMIICWKHDVKMDDFLADTETIGNFMTRPSAFELGSRIVAIRNYYVRTNDDVVTKHVMAELYVDEDTEKRIENYDKFKAVEFFSSEVSV